MSLPTVLRHPWLPGSEAAGPLALASHESRVPGVIQSRVTVAVTRAVYGAGARAGPAGPVPGWGWGTGNSSLGYSVEVVRPGRSGAGWGSQGRGKGGTVGPPRRSDTRTRGQWARHGFPRQAGPSFRVVSTESVRTTVRSACDSAGTGSGFKLGY